MTFDRARLVWRSCALALVSSLVLVAASACGGGAAARDGAGSGPVSSAEFDALYRARTDSARMRFTEADVRFMNAMIGHHAQALVMSGFAPTHGTSPSVRTLAARIINAQQDEIALMQWWLRDRGQPAPEVMIQGTSLMIHGAEHPTHGAGMLAPEQMAELERARGAEFDRLFLRYMIQHHRGAVVMVDELVATAGAAQDAEVFRLASDIHVDQTTEIARMEGMLAALEGDC